MPFQKRKKLRRYYINTSTAPLLLTGSSRGSEVQHYNEKESVFSHFSIQNQNLLLKT